MSTPAAPQVIFHDSPALMADTLAREVAETLNKSGPEARLVLPGGRSPRLLIEALAGHDISWGNITVTTTDERCVPDDSPDNNATQIARLLAPSPIRLLRLTQGTELTGQSTVTILGMGTDAHIASLFPAMPDNDDHPDTVIPATAPTEPRQRLSLTMAALTATKRLILLVPDREKWVLCQRLLKGDEPGLPLARLMRRAGSRLELHVTESA